MDCQCGTSRNEEAHVTIPTPLVAQPALCETNGEVPQVDEQPTDVWIGACSARQQRGSEMKEVIGVIEDSETQKAAGMGSWLKFGSNDDASPAQEPQPPPASTDRSCFDLGEGRRIASWSEFAWTTVGTRVNGVMMSLMDLISDSAKRDLKEPEMPMIIQKSVDFGLNFVFTELKYYVQSEVMDSLAIKKEDTAELEEPDFDIGGFRAWYRYAWFPYDRGPWQQLEGGHLITKFLCVIPAIPFVGLHFFFYLFHYIMIDTTDYYQLLCFILSCKTSFFVANAQILFLMGIGMFTNCTLHGYSTCAESDDNTNVFGMLIYFDNWAIPFQVVMCWVAMIKIGFSQMKGEFNYGQEYRPGEDGDDSKTHTIKCELESIQCCGNEFFWKRARRLRFLLYYDTVVMCIWWFITIAGAANIEGKWTSTDDLDREQKVQYFSWHILTKVFYGFVQLPFAALYALDLTVLFCRAKPTAYDENGVCRRLLSPRERSEKRINAGELVVVDGVLQYAKQGEPEKKTDDAA